MNKFSFYTQEVTWAEAKAALANIRQQVFVKEQKVPLDMELDEHDAHCNHLLAFDANGVPVGTVRLLPDGHIGRMAVLAKFRGKGIGSRLLTDIIRLAKAKGLREVSLHAQIHAVGFYEQHHFHAVGEEFMEAGIAHVQMQRKL